MHRLLLAGAGAALLAIARRRPDLTFAAIVEEGYVRGASHIHVGDRVRYRIDGVLEDGPRLSRRLRGRLARHLRAIGPRTTFKNERGIELDLFVHEDVLHLLVANTIALGLDALGFWPATEERLRAVARSRRGLVLVGGLAGSGRTTTAHGILEELDRKITHVAIREDLERFELLDADALLVDRLRDRRTAELALEAALDGHLVVATIVAGDATSAFDRLAGFGADPALLAAVRLVVAQTLARRRCRTCEGGCARCRGTGYKGRVALHELCVPDGPTRALARSFAEDARWKIEQRLTDEASVALALP